MFKQVDGVAMGSPLRPVLANIFVGYHETIFFNASCSQDLPEWYKRYVDDPFYLFITEELAGSFLNSLNNIHPFLTFTCEFENQRKLPFLDDLVHKEENGFLKSIYDKPTFTGLYTRYDSLSPKRQKISFIKCLIKRT